GDLQIFDLTGLSYVGSVSGGGCGGSNFVIDGTKGYSYCGNLQIFVLTGPSYVGSVSGGCGGENFVIDGTKGYGYDQCGNLQIFDFSWTLSGTPDVSDVGNYLILVKAKDPTGGVNSIAFTVNVIAPGGATPTLTDTPTATATSTITPT